ncbi:MAG: glycosyltransferase [Candidatus Bathyarchaeum sp.]|nr:MAG: glycosyltransferase [Candidatus Bathyarchaeum sp.]
MKVVYIALDPLKYPRIKKISSSLKKLDWVKFEVMIPKFRIAPRGSGRFKRLFLAVANYLAVFLQIFFVRADLFWVANCPDILAIPLVLRRRKYLLEYRSPWSIEVEDEFGKGPWVRPAAIIENIALRNALAITLTTSKLLKRVSGFGKPTFVIPNFSTKNFEASISADDFRKKYGVKRGEKIVLFVGKLTHVEGADLLPGIIEQVLKKVNCVFWIVGDGPSLPFLKTFEAKFGNKIKLFGWIPHEEVSNFVNAADVCLAPRHTSKYSQFYNEEGLHKIAEYMFFGKPIVACGIAESSQYLLVKENDISEGTIRALKGETPVSTPKTWEEHSAKKIFKLFSWLKSKT